MTRPSSAPRLAQLLGEATGSFHAASSSGGADPRRPERVS